MRRVILVVFLSCVATAASRAQEVRGAVLLENSSTVVAGVIVEARAVATGPVVARAVTDARGEFHLKLPAAGAYTFRGVRIGNHPTPFGELSVGTDERRIVRFFIAARPLALAEVRVIGNQFCGRRAMEASAVATLIDETRKALQVSQLGAALGTTAEWAVDHQMADLRGTPFGPITSEIYRGLTQRPFVSLSADSLDRVGYAVADSSGSTFYAPDAEALLSDHFVNGHCFRTVPPRGVDRAWIGLAFEPVPRRRDERIGISGTIWLDRASAELRRLDYQYANLSRIMAVREAGGQVSFRRVSDDLWIVDRWTIRMPSPIGADGRMEARSWRRGEPIQFIPLSLQTVSGRVRRVEREGDLVFAAAGDTIQPPLATAAALASYCPSKPLPGSGVVWGVLRDSANAPVANGRVDVEWDVGHRWVGEAQREWESLGRSAMTSPLGIWLACDIPTGVPLTAWGQLGDVSGTSALLVIPVDSLGIEARLMIGERPIRRDAPPLVGVVFDSLRGGGPVADAEVRVLGTSHRAFTDSVGRFEFGGLPSGPTTVVWRDVELDVLGVAPPAATGVAGQPADLVVASPSAETYAELRCGSMAIDGGGVLVGEVVDLQGARRAGVEVRAAWGRLLLGRTENRAEALAVADTTDAGGRYALCGLPRSATVGVEGAMRSLISGDITLSASGPGLSAGPIIVRLEGRGALRRDIIAGESQRVRLEGRVLGADSKPLAGAAVSIAGTLDERPPRTDSTGAWALDSVLVQTTEIEVRALGYIPARVVLDPKRGQLSGGTIRMERLPQILDANVIVGQLTQERRNAFEERRRIGLGTFLDEAVLGRIPRSPSGLRSRVSRSNVVGIGIFQRFVLETNSIMSAAICDPLWFIDGMSNGRLSGDEQQAVIARAKMIEVYRAWDAPAQYIDFNGCGVVLVWTDDR